jgi:hypothetical protein
LPALVLLSDRDRKITQDAEPFQLFDCNLRVANQFTKFLDFAHLHLYFLQFGLMLVDPMGKIDKQVTIGVCISQIESLILGNFKQYPEILVNESGELLHRLESCRNPE